MMKVVPLQLFGRQCTQVAELAHALAELTAIAGLAPQATAMRRVEAELAELAESDGVQAVLSAEDLVGTVHSAVVEWHSSVAVGSSHREPSASPVRGVERSANAGGTGPLHLSVSDLHADTEDLRLALQKMEAVGDETRTELRRLGVELQALCGEVAGASGEARLSRQEAQQALTELSTVRADVESHESRLRALAAEGQHLRTHVSTALQRSSEDADASHARLAADSQEVRSALSQLAKESRELRQSVDTLEQAERQRRAENLDTPGQAELMDMVAASEQRNSQRINEVHEALQAWQRRASEQRQGILQNSEEVRNALGADLQELRTKVDQVLSRGQLDEWAKVAATAADTVASDTGVSGIGEEKLPRACGPVSQNRLTGIEDMPRPWRSALEDVVRRVHWVSDEARREQLRRCEEDRASTEARLTTMNSEQARRLAEAHDAAEEAIRRADNAVSAAQLAAELGKEHEEALMRSLADNLGAHGADLRAELKAATGEIHTRIEDVAGAQRLRCASLEEACAGLRQDFALLDSKGRNSDEVVRSIQASLREVSDTAHNNAQAIDEQKVTFKVTFDPFRDEVGRQLRKLGQEAEQLRSVVDNRTQTLTNEVSVTKSNLETRCGEINSSLVQLSSRMDCEVIESAERAGKVEALKRRLGEEAAAAVDARCSEMGQFAACLRDTLLTEVRDNLAGKLRSIDEVSTRVNELGIGLEFTNNQANSRSEQLQAAFAAAEKQAGTAREDSAEALRRTRRLETLLAALIPGSTAASGTAGISIGGNPAPQSAKDAAAADTGASGSAMGAARLLRSGNNPPQMLPVGKPSPTPLPCPECVLQQ